MQAGFGSDGQVQGMSMGGDNKAKKQDFRNQKVVNALRKISKQDFGFNALAWKSWYIGNHTHVTIKVRR